MGCRYLVASVLYRLVVGGGQYLATRLKNKIDRKIPFRTTVTVPCSVALVTEE